MMKEHLRSPSQKKNSYSTVLVVDAEEMFNFMQELESLSFPESVVRVAELAHIPLDVEDPF